MNETTSEIKRAPLHPCNDNVSFVRATQQVNNFAPYASLLFIISPLFRGTEVSSSLNESLKPHFLLLVVKNYCICLEYSLRSFL